MAAHMRKTENDKEKQAITIMSQLWIWSNKSAAKLTAYSIVYGNFVTANFPKSEVFFEKS